MEACKKWYVLYTKRNKEIKVVEELIENGFEAYTPIKKEKRKWSDRIIIKKICLLPSMVLVCLEKHKINKVFEINYVKKYMFFNGERAKVSNDEVLAMKNYIKNKKTINKFLKKGDSIKINYLNQNATVIDVKGKKCFAFLEMLGATITLNVK
tara:strand:- start:8251 stop:8709 length:459 start_codon:yes stop_codon:yes gene_type:complete